MEKSIIYAVTGLLCLFLANDAIAQKEGEFHLDKNYEISAIGTFHLNSEDAEVRITGSSRSDVHVKIDRIQTIKGFTSARSEFDVRVESRGGDLYITERERSGVRVQVGTIRTDYTIDIELPASVSIRIVGEDDDYVVRNVNGRISMEVEDGDIEIIDCKGDYFQFELEDGDLKLDAGSGKLMANIEDGDIEVRRGTFENVDIEVEDGDVILETSLSDGGTYDLRGEDATIEFIVTNGGGEFLIMKVDASVRSSSEYETIQETDHRAKLKLNGGSANVEIRTDDRRVRLSKN